MTDFERINAPRVAKIMETLDLIAKSARSQRVEGGLEHAALLRPVWDRLDRLGCDLLDAEREAIKAASPGPIIELPKPRSQDQRSDMALRATLEQAPLADLPMAMAVIMNRVDELIAEKK